MQRKLKTLVLISAVIAMMVLNSCDDVNNSSDFSEEGNILISTSLPSADGLSGAAYMQLIDDLEEKELTNSSAIPTPFSSVPCVCGDDIFIIPGWSSDEVNVMTKYSRSGGELVEESEYTLPSSSSATSVVTKGDTAYVACAAIAKILVINHEKMELIDEIDVSAYGYGDEDPNASSMLIRDNLLYVPLYQCGAYNLQYQEHPYSEILIIDTRGNEIVKMITDSTSGISTPTRPIDPYSIFMDENEDIYISCLGGFGYVQGHMAGLLRIKAGETEFDKDYKFVYNTTAISGEDNTLSYLAAVRYYGNGKLYATANVPAYYSNPMDYIEDRATVPVEIDIYNQTITKLDLPNSNCYGVAVGTFEDQVVFGLATTTSNGFYTYDPSTGEASSSATVTTTGYPFSFVAFDE